MAQHTNEKLQNVRYKKLSLKEYIRGIRNEDVVILSQAITLMESNRDDDKKLSMELIDSLLKYSGSAKRIGITGPPGVGKSTFIEKLGTYCIQEKKMKIAVLAIDPSSPKSKGSILGDKTRMLTLSREEKAFIRPSPSSGEYGGVARRTRESMILCEAAGYEAIIIETLGTGQSELAVNSLVDFFLLLALPGSGDELQGIKRGIMELAHAIAITKADSDLKKEANLAFARLQSAVQLQRPEFKNWETPVYLTSADDNFGFDKTWNIIEEFYAFLQKENHLKKRREMQLSECFHENLKRSLVEHFLQNQAMQKKYDKYKNDILRHDKNPFTATEELISYYYKNL